MEFIEQIKEKSSRRKKTIILPESSDERVLKAADILSKEKKLLSCLNLQMKEC